MLPAQRRIFISVLIITNDYRSAHRTHGLTLSSCQHSSASYHSSDSLWDYVVVWRDGKYMRPVSTLACGVFSNASGALQGL